MADAFSKKYGIKVNVYNANSETVLQRVVQEATANKLGNDVLVAPATDMAAMESKGLLGDYSSSYRDAMPRSRKVQGLDRGAPPGVRRRLQHRQGSPSPTSRRTTPDFADPRWKGRISMEYSDIDWYATLRRYYEQRGYVGRRLRVDDGPKIAANSKTAKGHTVQTELLAAGQFDAALSVYTQSDRQAHRQGRGGVFRRGQRTHRQPGGSPLRRGRCDARHRQPGRRRAVPGSSSSGPMARRSTSGCVSLPPLPTEHDPLAGAEVIDLDVADFVANRTKIADEYNQLVTGS